MKFSAAFSSATKASSESVSNLGGNGQAIRLPDGSVLPLTASRIQIAFAEILCRPAFEHFLGLVIFGNLALTVVETDLRVKDHEVPNWMRMLDIGLVIFYATELVLRLYIWRLTFFQEKLHIFEAALVVCDIIFKFIGSLPNIKVLRVIRLMRLARTLRILMHFRELYIMAYGMIAAMKALFWAAVMLTVWLTVWSIVTVEIIHPLNEDIAATGFYGDCDRCGRAYSSVPQAVLTYIQQIVAGDSWGLVTIPIMERYPATALVFFSVLVTVNFGLLNLILAVIVDKAQQAREGDLEMRLKEKAEAWKQAKAELEGICQKMDEDSSGQLTLSELLDGYDNDEAFRAQINMMDLHREDLNILFEIFDKDGSGAVTHKEFIKELHKVKTEDSHMMLVVMRHSLRNLQQSFREFMKDIRGQSMTPKLCEFGPQGSPSNHSFFTSGEQASFPVLQDKLSSLDLPQSPSRLGKELVREAAVSASAISLSQWGSLDEAFNHLQRHLEEQLAILSKELVTKFEVHARSHDRRLDAILGSVMTGSMKIERVTSAGSAGRTPQQVGVDSGRKPGLCMPNDCHGVFGITP